MLSQHTQRLLANVFLATSEGEKQAEILRGVLAEHPSFDPARLFGLVAAKNRQSIQLTDIPPFLDRVRVRVADISAVFEVFDSDHNGRWSFKDFLNLILPRGARVVQKPAVGQDYGSGEEKDTVDDDGLLYALALLMSREAEIATCVESARERLFYANDFDERAAFTTIDDTGTDKIDHDSLYLFLKRLDPLLTEREVFHVFRRLELSSLDYSSFLRYIRPRKLLKNSMRKLDDRGRRPSQLERRYNSRNASPVGDVSLSNRYSSRASDVRRKESQRPSPHGTPRRATPSTPQRKKSDLSMERKSEVGSTPNARLQKHLMYKGSLLKFTLGLLEAEGKLLVAVDRMKRELSASGCKPQEVYAAFDLRGIGAVTREDFVEALATTFALCLPPPQIDALFCRFARESLRLTEFCQIFGENSTSLSKRSLSSRRGGKPVFSEEVRSQVKNFWKILLKSEDISEEMRQDLFGHPQFDLYETFRLLDRRSVGFITSLDMKSLLPNSTEDEIEQIMRRFDKNQDGVISYTDFTLEITPKRFC